MNNNLVNVNNTWTGSTHLDNITVLSNVLVKNIINTSNYIYNSSNDLANNIINTSNYIYNSSNQISNEFKNLIYQETETDILSKNYNHTCIYNSNVLGEIRFWTKSTSTFPVQIPLDVPDYRVKIDRDGKLKLYYTYDSSINLTWGNGWCDVINIVIGILANNANMGVILGTLQNEIGALAIKEDTDIKSIISIIADINAGDLSADMTFEQLQEYRQGILTATSSDEASITLNSVFNSVCNGVRTRNIAYFGSALSTIQLWIGRNPAVGFALGVGGIVFGMCYGYLQNIEFNNYIQSLNRQINSNISLSITEKRSLIDYNSNVLIASNIIEICQDFYNISFCQGFVNSNILTLQVIPNIQTNYINISGNIVNNTGNIYVSPNNFYYGSAYYLSNIQLSTNSSITSYSSNFLPKTGGSLSGGLAVLTGTVNIPTTGNFGGIGDRIILNSGSTGVYPYSIGINTNSFWNSIPTSASFNWYINGVNNMTLSSGILNIIGNVQENSNNLSTIYATNTNLNSTITNVNNTLNLVYTSERQYPPKLYDSSSTETTITFLNKTVYYESITVNSYINGYMIGNYNLYSSTSYSSANSKKLLFNYNTVETAGAHWALSQYTIGGLYNSTNYILSNYLGDWVIIQLPNPIILTRFRFYSRATYTNRAPAEWKCYGSIDGITFTEITEGHNLTKLSATDYASGYYEKTLASTFTTPYLYIGWCVNKLAGDDYIMNFIELQIFGKELLNPIYNYISSNTILNILTPFITSNVLGYQQFINSNSVALNYINSNVVQNILTPFITSNVLGYQQFINSNSVALNYINSNVVRNILTPFITSNVLGYQQFINSNSVALNYINSNVVQNILTPFITSNVLGYQQFINSNSVALNYVNSNIVQNLLTPCITSNVLTSVLISYLPLYRIYIPSTSAYLDPTNLLRTYDLQISNYVKTFTFSKDAGLLIRVFEITTIIENTDWDYANQVFNQGFFETITIYMSNFKFVSGAGTVLPNFCNGKIIGKQNNTNIGYWNTMTDNFNYIRFLSQTAWDLNVSIRPLF